MSSERASMDDFEAQLRRATKLRISLVSRLTLCANGGCPYSDEMIPVLEYHIRIVDCTDLVAASAMSHARAVSEHVRAAARATVSAAADAAALAHELGSSSGDSRDCGSSRSRQGSRRGSRGSRPGTPGTIDGTSAGSTTPDKRRNLLSKMTNGKFGEGRHRAEMMQKLRRLSGVSLPSEGSESLPSPSGISGVGVHEGGGGGRRPTNDLRVVPTRERDQSPLASSPVLSPRVTGEPSSNPLDSLEISSELIAALAAGLPLYPAS